MFSLNSGVLFAISKNFGLEVKKQKNTGGIEKLKQVF